MGLFTKKVKVGPKVSAQGYKEVTDWGAVFGAIIIVLVIIGFLAS